MGPPRVVPSHRACDHYHQSDHLPVCVLLYAHSCQTAGNVLLLPLPYSVSSLKTNIFSASWTYKGVL